MDNYIFLAIIIVVIVSVAKVIIFSYKFGVKETGWQFLIVDILLIFIFVLLLNTK